ncbi:MAG: tripartite tricarboxylate transporter substrate-binding protein [Pseudomonadota bacterium]
MIRGLLIAVCAWASFTQPGAATENAEAFYRDRTLTLFVGHSPGGGYDAYARAVGRHIGKHIPGEPDIVVKNMPGAGSVRLGNYLAEVAEADGSVFATLSRDAAMAPLLSPEGIRFDAQQFGWLGSVTDAVSTCIVAAQTGITDWSTYRTEGIAVGATGYNASSGRMALILENVFDADFEIVTGYPGSADYMLALDRGEIDSVCMTWASILVNRPDWVPSGAVNVIVQLGLRPAPDLPDVPTVLDLAETDEQRALLQVLLAPQQMGRPFMTPPGVPAERLEVLRSAFDATMADPAFQADLERAGMAFAPMTGAEVEALIAEVHAEPPATIEAAKAALRP